MKLATMLCLILATSIILSTVRSLLFLPRVAWTAPTVIFQPIPLYQEHLFGIFTHTVINAPNTTLPIVLEGTWVNDNTNGTSSQNLAIISINGATADVYQVGQSLNGLATVTSIQSTQVIITHNNQEESLPLPAYGT